MNRIGSTLLVTLPADCDADVMLDVSRSIGEQVHRHHDETVVLDASAVEIIDITDAEALRQTCQTIKLMGSRPVLAGLRPELVAALVHQRVDLAGIECVLDVAAWMHDE